jgi:exopolyphosphatase/guanosine-5'-triphosphate,3'-diphosphate pyrophosphatase
MNKEIVTIDLGSNSFRVLKYDCKNHKIISEYNEVVGMADGLVDTGIISKEAMARVIKAIFHSIEVINYNPQDAICETTAAMRKALNKEEVLQYFRNGTGANFSIIDGNEEARLTLLAVKYALKRENINSNNFILLDIGGGSTEIIINTNEKYKAHSFDFGIVTMTQKYLKFHDLYNDLRNRKVEIKTFLDSLNIEDLKNYSFVATAGTPTTIAAIKLGQDFFSYDKNVINGTVVDLEDLDYCLDIFKNSTEEEISRLVGRGRVEFIEVGILIYQTIFEVLNKKESIVLDDGLREGVAIDYCLKCKKI